VLHHSFVHFANQDLVVLLVLLVLATNVLIVIQILLHVMCVNLVMQVRIVTLFVVLIVMAALPLEFAVPVNLDGQDQTVMSVLLALVVQIVWLVCLTAIFVQLH